MTPRAVPDATRRGRCSTGSTRRSAGRSPPTPNPLCILAGAGSGKTRVLTRRIAYRAATGDADPRHVLALTFTRKAAGELATRLRRARAARPARRRHVPRRRLRPAREPGWAERAARRPRCSSARVGCSAASSAGRRRMARARARGRDRVGQGPAGRPRRLRRGGRAGRPAHRRSPRDRVAALYAALRGGEAPARRGRLRRPAAPLRARRSRSDRTFAAAQRWRFRHLFVDEFQDVNPLQHRLLDGWLGRPRRPVRGRRPQPGHLRLERRRRRVPPRLRRHRHGGQVVELDDNYRSSPEILAVAAAVLDGGGRRPLTAHRPTGPVPDRRRLPDRHRRGARHRPGRARPPPPGGPVGPPGRARPHQRPDAAHRGGAPPGPHPVPGAGRGTVPRPARGRRGARRPWPRPPAGWPLALAELAADVAAGRRPDRPASARPADHVDALVQLGQEFLALEPAGIGGRPAALAGGDGPARRRARAAPTRSRSSPSTRPRASSGRSSTSPGSRTGFVPISHARSAEAEAEERRLLYVAVTRAEEVLRCTWAERRQFGQTDDGPAAVAVPGRAGRRDRGAAGGGRRRRPRPGSRRGPAPTSTGPSRPTATPTLLDALQRLARPAGPPGPGAGRRSCSPTSRWSSVAERRPQSGRRPRPGEPGVGPGQGRRVRGYRPGPRGRRTRGPHRRPWTADVRFELRQRIAAPRRRRRRAPSATRRTTPPSAGRRSSARPRCSTATSTATRSSLRIRYRFIGDLSSAATRGARPGQAHLGRGVPPRPRRAPRSRFGSSPTTTPTGSRAGAGTGSTPTRTSRTATVRAARGRREGARRRSSAGQVEKAHRLAACGSTSRPRPTDRRRRLAWQLTPLERSASSVPIWRRAPRGAAAKRSGGDRDEDALGLGGEQVAGVQQAGGEDLAALLAVEAALEAEVGVQRRGLAVADRERAGHARRARERLGRAEDLVERGGDVAAVHAAGRALVGRRRR